MRPLSQSPERIRAVGRIQVRAGRDGVLSVLSRVTAVTARQRILLIVIIPAENTHTDRDRIKTCGKHHTTQLQQSQTHSSHELRAQTGSWVIPHQTHHGLHVSDESLVSAEDLRSRIVAEGEPGSVFLNQLLASARIEHLLEVPATAEH